MKFLRFIFSPLALLPLAVLLAGCFPLASELQPPPGAVVRANPTAQSSFVQPTQQAAPTNQTFFPLVAPDPVNGQAIYAEKCAPCHGDTGRGDGPKAAELPNPVIPIGDPTVARMARPADWYQVVTMGRIDRYMPPFNSLSDRQRWDVVAYALTLSTPQEVIDLGKELYLANCARCHGEDGRGNGVDAATLSQKPANLTEQQRLADLSAADLFGLTLHPPFKDMPDFETTFTASDRWALTAFVRTLSFSTPGTTAQTLPTTGDPAVLEPVVTAEAATDAASSVTVQVFNAPGTPLLPDLTVELYAYENFEQVFAEQLPATGEGTYTYLDPQMKAGRVYLAAINYNGVTFTSDIVVAESDLENLLLPVQVYDVTTDQSSIVVDRLHVFFEFIDVNLVRVSQLFIISNTDSRVVIAPSNEQPVLIFNLPEGATNLQFQDGVLGDRYVEIPGGFGDRSPVYPGASQTQILFSYDFVYDRKLDIIQQLNLPVSAAIVMLPDSGIKFKSDQMVESSPRQVQDVVYQVYTGGNLAAGSELSFNISGSVREESGIAIDTSNRNNLMIGLGAFGIVLIGAGAWLYYGQQSTNGEKPSPEEVLEEEEAAPVFQDAEAVMDAILALDDQYKRGDLPEIAYLERRSALKAQLAKIHGLK